MARYGYQPRKKPFAAGAAAPAQPRVARARLMGVNASYKDLVNVCANIRGWQADDALDFLSKAARKERAILFTSHNSGKGHRRELGGKKGGWPVKSVKIVMGVLENAMANAAKNGLGQTRIAHIAANKQNTYPRLSPKGRRIRHDLETAFVEIVLEETQQKAEGKKRGGSSGKKLPGQTPKEGAGNGSGQAPAASAPSAPSGQAGGKPIEPEQKEAQQEASRS
jgi:ribosomal protein uL22